MNLNEAINFCDNLIENNKEKIINKVSDMMLTQVLRRKLSLKMYKNI